MKKIRDRIEYEWTFTMARFWIFLYRCVLRCNIDPRSNIRKTVWSTHVRWSQRAVDLMFRDLGVPSKI